MTVSEQEDPKLEGFSFDGQDFDISSELDDTDGVDVESGENTDIESDDIETDVHDADDTAEVDDPETAPDQNALEGGTAKPKKKKNAWLTKLRKDSREKDKRIKELEQKISSLAPQSEVVEPVGAEPKVEDFYDDPGEYAIAYKAWFDRKQAAERKAQEMTAREQAEKDQWLHMVQRHADEKKRLKVANIDEVEKQVTDFLTPAQQGMIIQGSENSAKLVHFLGTNQNLLAHVANVEDPVKFAFLMGQLDARLKNDTGRSRQKPPESRLKGNAVTSPGGDVKLERLRQEAARTGDYTKVSAYRRALKKKT